MTSYTVRVEWPDIAASPNSTADSTADVEARALDLVDRLGPTASIGLGHTHHGRPEPWTATITLDATTPRGAATKAVGVVESATGIPATGFEVLETVEYDRRLEQPMLPDLVGNADIAEILGVSSQRVTQLTQLNGFPPSVLDTRNGGFRVRQHVEAWAKTWPRKPGRPARNA